MNCSPPLRGNPVVSFFLPGLSKRDPFIEEKLAAEKRSAARELRYSKLTDHEMAMNIVAMVSASLVPLAKMPFTERLKYVRDFFKDYYL